MSLRILAVDDSLTMREMLRQTLTEAGFDVVLAEDGIDALQQLPDVAPDLILTDLNMPKMDGFGLIDAVRKGDVSPRVPILVLTTESAATLKERARSSGATGWITKPFDEQSLVSTIRRVAAV
ncbi:MAG: response regulator [Pseudotabrizicola sp.]|uniref:response regulator n=1 Tax=Pseudotabrizicola sp. TaxID=2939647 RepID=UPI002723E669|nr:response regulator [Pseudotabrizicola sp.]MDO8882229.1 response regulator [Pseudotabrizicola sp.]MDP2079459.1 response regulator [Pseudotabrizicola sp.]MDZ7573649.1 response regulator [Pseudotabrizicola sp.]